MHRLLERLDNAAAQIVPLLYLLGLALGAASYFAGVTLDAGLAVGFALAIAAELHSFLQQRRLRASYAQLARLTDDAPEREAALRQVKVNGWILAALLAFSSYNAVAFIAATWRPVPGFLPGWLQIGIRGLVIPGFFFASGFLTPLHTDAGEQLQTASADMLRRTLKAIARQWRTRLDKARSRGADLAGVAVALMLDAGDTGGARRIELIAQGLTTAERPQIAPTLEDAPATGPQRPPTGPGSPTAAPDASRQRSSQRPAVLRLTPAQPERQAQPRKRAAARASVASKTTHAKGVRTPTASVETQARAAWRPGMSVTDLQTAAKISRNAAMSWRRALIAEGAPAMPGGTHSGADAGQLAQ